MDVQNAGHSLSRLNSLGRSSGSTRSVDWADALNQIAALPARTAEAARDQPSDRAFANLLDQAIQANPAADPASGESSRDRQIREKSQMIVNQFFVGSMLKQMRESPFKSELFGGGKGGEAYQGMMDRHLAENAGSHVARSLVDSLVKSYHKQEAAPEQIFADPQQQLQFQKYQESKQKRVIHESATALTA